MLNAANDQKKKLTRSEFGTTISTDKGLGSTSILTCTAPGAILVSSNSFSRSGHDICGRVEQATAGRHSAQRALHPA
jgi:hypothetical protein